MDVEKNFPEFLKGEWNLKKGLLAAAVLIAALLVVKVVLSLLPKAIFLFMIFAPPVFVLADAQERKIKRPFLWAIFTLFTSIFGLTVYLLARPEIKQKVTCNFCNGEIEESFKICPWCGKTPVVMQKCASCSAEIKSDWKFCPGCGSTIKSDVASCNPSSNQ
ncbi:MAG: zinc ribbon domain-containing protein [Candidatus Riflebacteria bacterium]|nr:zinc ribbon domain-containing protein [Candidatus Riflebacteria bacterium]